MDANEPNMKETMICLRKSGGGAWREGRLRGRRMAGINLDDGVIVKGLLSLTGELGNSRKGTRSL